MLRASLEDVSLDTRAKKFGPGTVVIPVGDHLRHPDFVIDLCNLTIPPGSNWSMVRSASITQNR